MTSPVDSRSVAASSSRSHRVATSSAAVLHVFDEGPTDAPCVVLAHSIMTGARMWEPQLATLRALGFRIVRPETRGHGHSTASTPPYSLGELAADMVAVLDALGIAKVHFVGLSLGGSIGVRLSAIAANRLLSLVICDARVDGPEALAGVWEERIATAARDGMGPLVESTLQRWFSDRSVPPIVGIGGEHEEARAMIASLISQTRPDGFIGAARAIQRFDDVGLLASICVPTTFVVGTEDGTLPALMAGFAVSVKDSVFEAVDGAGHIANIEAPNAFDAVLARHLSRVGF